MKIKPTPPPRTPAVVRRRVARTAMGAGAVAAGLILACGEKSTPPQLAPAEPPQVAPQPPQGHPPQVAPQPPPQPPPPQPFDAGSHDADDASDAEDAG